MENIEILIYLILYCDTIILYYLKILKIMGEEYLLKISLTK